MENLQFGIYVDLVLGGACFSFPVLACVAMHKPEYPQAIRKLLVLFSVSHWCCGLTQICRAFYLYNSPLLLGVLDALKVITVIVVVLTSITLWNSLPQLVCFHFRNNNIKLPHQPTNQQTYEQTNKTDSLIPPTCSTDFLFSNSKHNKLNTTTDSLVLPTTTTNKPSLYQTEQSNTKHDMSDSPNMNTISCCSPITTPTCSEQDESEISCLDDGCLDSPLCHQKFLKSPPPVVPLRATKSCEDLTFAFSHLQVQFQKQRKIRDKAKRELLKKSNEALTKEKLRWQAVWDVTPLMLWLIAPNGDVVKFNRLWYEYTGLTEPECVVTSGIIPDLTKKLLPPEEVKDYLAEWFRCLERGTTFELKARLKRHTDAEYRWHLVTTVPVRDPETQAIIQWCGGAADIHDAEIVAKLIAEDARRKCRFLATISHEMRTPLNGILGMTTCLRDTQLQPAQVDLVNNVSQCADQLLVLINNILDLIQIKKKRVHLEDSVFTVREVVQDALSIVVEQAVNKQISISTDITITKPIRTDYKRLRQILINLLTNAVKFTPAGGMIVVGATSITQDGRPYVCFSVKDSGIGIPEEDMPKLYGMFSQVDSQGVRPFGGSGLGLAIAKGIVTLLRGNIWCESKVGKGTTFYFTCPIPDSIDGDASDLAVLQSPIITSNSLPTTPPLLAKRKESSPSILVVDDNHLNQTVLKRTLESIGYSDVAVAGDGAEALEMVKMHSYDVIFMDVEMPVMDGTVSTTLIRTFSETLEKQPHIIAVTANSVDDEVEKCFEAGMCRHMAKPIRRDTIRKCIDEYLSLIYPGLQCCRCTSNATTTTTTNSTITPTSNTVQIQQTTTIQTQTPKKLLFEPPTGAELLIPEVTSKSTTTGYSIIKQQCIPELQLSTKNSKTKFNSTLQQQRESPIITTKTFPSRVLTHRRSYKPEQPVN